MSSLYSNPAGTLDVLIGGQTVGKFGSQGLEQAGTVIQVVNFAYSTTTSSSSVTPVNTGLTASITPKYATSKILVDVSVSGCLKQSSNTALILKLNRNSTKIVDMEGYAGITSSTADNGIGSCSCSYLDNPATTSATSYTVQLASSGNSASVSFNNAGGNVATSTITLMEIKQ